MNLVVKLRIEQYPEAEGDHVKRVILIETLMAMELPGLVNVEFVNKERQAVCIGIVVDEEDDEDVRHYVTREAPLSPVVGGPPYKVRPKDGGNYVAGPGGLYPVPTNDDLDHAEAEFRDVEGSGLKEQIDGMVERGVLTLVPKEEKRDDEAGH